MPRAWGDDATAGSFEELPVILVVLVAVSLFSVTVASQVNDWGAEDEYSILLEDCQSFAGMLRGSHTLGADGHPGTFDTGALANASAKDLMEEFNPALLGFEYRVLVQCINISSGEAGEITEMLTSPLPAGSDMATFHTCVNTDNWGRIGAARLTVTVWRALP